MPSQNSAQFLLDLKGKTITDVHVSADRAGQPVTATLWLSEGQPVLVGSDEHGLVVSVDTLDEQIEDT